MRTLQKIAINSGLLYCDKCWQCGSKDLDVAFYGTNRGPEGYSVGCLQCGSWYSNTGSGIEMEKGTKLNGI